MKTFTIKSSLAYGLSHRLRTMDGQAIVDACSSFFNALVAIRKNMANADKINEANAVFVRAVEDTEAKKRVIFDEEQKNFQAAKTEIKKDDKEATAKEAELSRKFQTEFNKKAAEVQKLSKADPDSLISVSLGDDEYEKVLIPVFMKTAQLWDVDGNGKGQELFVQVGDAIENLTPEVK